MKGQFMKHTRLIFLLLLAAIVLAFSACQGKEQADTPIYYATSPIADGNAEENAILRDPTKVGDPEDYAPLTEETAFCRKVRISPCLSIA